MKPKIFIGSSKEGINFARAIKEQLSEDAYAILWDEGPFRTGEYTLESLEIALTDFDFAIIVFTKDDKIISKETESFSPRDNVIFELGLFLGAYGRHRTFIVCENGIKVPSDIKGITIGMIEWPYHKNNYKAAVGNAVVAIREKIKDPKTLHKASKVELGFFDIKNTEMLGWTLYFVGQDKNDTLVQLNKQLRIPIVSDNGEGKRIESGFCYWGLGPTLAWHNTCTDILYRVMFESIKNFPDKWGVLQNKLPHKNFHYVSLGSGTGIKDRVIMNSLVLNNEQTIYFPIDMSSEMLSLSVSNVFNNKLKKSQILPINIDFSSVSNMKDLRQIIDKIVGDAPILYSILGNTIANFDDDVDLLKNISDILLREGDVLLVELATTSSLTKEYQDAIKAEYKNTESFHTFVTSALLQATDLDLVDNSISFSTEIDEENCPKRAIKMKVYYKNMGDKKEVHLLGGQKFIFKSGDTIRLIISRKYTEIGIKDLVESANLKIIDSIKDTYNNLNDKLTLGVTTLLLKKK